MDNKEPIKIKSFQKVFNIITIVEILAVILLTVAYFADSDLPLGLMVFFWISVPFMLFVYYILFFTRIGMVHIFYDTRLFVQKKKKDIMYDDILEIEYIKYSFKRLFFGKRKNMPALMKIKYNENDKIKIEDLNITYKSVLKIEKEFNLNIKIVQEFSEDYALFC